MPFTSYLDQKLIKHTLGGGAYTAPTTLYFALFTATPSASGGGTEVSGVNYTRIAGTFSFAASGNGWQATNAATVQFSAAGTGGWGLITHFAIFDASTGGNMLAYATLTDPASGYVTALSKQVDYGDSIRFDTGAAIVTLT